MLDAKLCPYLAREKLRSEGKQVQIQPGFSVHGATGHKLQILGLFNLTFWVHKRQFEHPVFIVDGLPAGAIMGYDLIKAQ